jgi:CRISPR-associated protein Csy1
LEHQDKNGSYKSLSQYVVEGDKKPFEPLTDNKEVIDEWLCELQKAFGAGRKSSHFLAKQIYFPLVDSHKYHMLLPIVSSSMAQALHLKFTNVFNDESKKARDQRKANLFSSDLVVYYPNKASIKTTVSNHTNASELNGKRGGKLALLSCSPPQWQQKLKPPLKKESLFYAELGYRSRESIKDLQKLLMAIKINERSKNDPKVHSKITLYVNEIIDVVFDYVQSIQVLKDEVGWSKNSALKEAHQLWLDPYRDDDEFQKKRSQKEWHQEIGHDFSMWLNKQLEHKKMIPGKQLQRLWKDIFAPRFREFYAISEVTL